MLSINHQENVIQKAPTWKQRLRLLLTGRLFTFRNDPREGEQQTRQSETGKEGEPTPEYILGLVTSGDNFAWLCLNLL